MHHLGIKKLLLLGAGHAHVQVLSQLAQSRPADLDVTVLTPYPFQTYSGMTPGYVAGRYSHEQCQIPLEPLMRAAGARWVHARCTGIDAGARQVQLSSFDAKAPPSSMGYDLLSVDTGAVLDRNRLEVDIPGATNYALVVRPIEVFASLWPKVLAHALQRPVSVVVVGAGAAGIELVFAAAQGIRAAGLQGASFTLVTGGTEVGANYTPGVQRRVLRQLKARGITVLKDSCTGMSAGAIQLGSGATLTCDVPILAIGTHAPPWLQGSGLDLADSGHLLVNAFQQSTSHPEVFAAGDVATRADTAPPQERGVRGTRPARHWHTTCSQHTKASR